MKKNEKETSTNVNLFENDSILLQTATTTKFLRLVVTEPPLLEFSLMVGLNWVTSAQKIRNLLSLDTGSNQNISIKTFGEIKQSKVLG